MADRPLISASVRNWACKVLSQQATRQFLMTFDDLDNAIGSLAKYLCGDCGTVTEFIFTPENVLRGCPNCGRTPGNPLPS